mmetsp:Transcript_19898/g.37156  ORF Transcript_19898/g.37156 Transcript_19898/m.37156 type:complete len:435 (+) Transcript_19898:3-1307(+)
METMRIISTKDIIGFFPRLHQQLGSNVCRLSFPVPGCPYTCSVVDTDLTREILTDKTTVKAEGLIKSFEKVTCNVPQFFTSNGHRFHHARKAMAPAFSNAQVARMNNITMARTEEWMQRRLDQFAKHGDDIDINQEMIDLALTIILEAAFEYGHMPLKEREMLLSCVTITLKEFVFAHPLKMMFGFLFPSVWYAHRCARELMRIARKIMSNYRRIKNPTKGTVIDLIMNNPNYATDDERAADIVDLIVAGHETSSNSMTMLLLELAKNPAEQFKLQKELREMSVEERPGSQQLKSCIRESMRLWPVTAPGPIRQVGRDYVVESKDPNEKDIVIPKGSLVFMPVIGLFHNSSIFEDHERFMPARWECPSEEMRKAWMPFGLGTRNCLGQSLATCEMHSVLSQVCANYNFEVVDEGTVDFLITLKPVGVRLKASRI